MPSAEIRIVEYDPRYLEQILALAREMHAESASHNNMPLDEAKLLEQLSYASSAPDNVYLRLAVRGDELLGGFFGMTTSTFFSQQRAARDMAWFVRRNHRGGMAALALVADFERWAKQQGIQKLFLGQSTGVAIETTRRLYEHMGYRVIGVNTVKDIA